MGERLNVLDMCCGKGGDQYKWGSDVEEFLGIDSSECLLSELREMRQSGSHPGPESVVLVKGDARKPILCLQRDKYHVASCMLGLNYMMGLGELGNCLTNMCVGNVDFAICMSFLLILLLALRTFSRSGDSFCDRS